MASKGDDFLSADVVGLRQLLNEEFIQFRGMIFRGTKFKQEVVAFRAEKESPQELQREVNHTHMVLYVGDPDVQLEWAARLRARWAERLRREFPDLPCRVVVDRTDGDAVVTFFAERDDG